MSTWNERFEIIPRTAKVVAALLTIGMVVLIAILTHLPPTHGEAVPPFAAKIFLPIMAGAVVLIYVLLVGFVYGDAKQRGMRYVMWTLLAIFLPDAIGIILYFILRDKLPTTCPHCSTKVVAKFAFCPNCGTSVKPTCPHCGQAVEVVWTNCAYCGTKLPSPTPRTA
jgi:double zinc ribbon protein